MKRTNLVLDEKLLEEARKLVGARTYSEAVNLSLREMVRLKHIDSLPSFFGAGLHWDGNLSEMREDSAPPARSIPKRKRAVR